MCSERFCKSSSSFVGLKQSIMIYMLCSELINELKQNFKFSISSIEELSQYEYYWGYSSISSYKKIERSIDKYLKAVLKFNYSDFEDSGFNYLKKINGGEQPLFDHKCFFF